MYLRSVFSFLGIICGFISNSQVNLNSGTPEVSLPLFKYEDAINRLSGGISLNYVGGSGIRVESVAGSTGTGWELNYGGSITRLQRGEPDDQVQTGSFVYPGYFGTGTISSTHASNYDHYKNNYFPSGFLTSQYSPSSPIDIGGAYSPLYNQPRDHRPPPQYLADLEQDIFVFTFNGRQGSFVIGKNLEIKSLEDSRLKFQLEFLTMSGNVRTNISGFSVIDETGIKYVFRDLELSEVIKYDEGYRNIGGVVHLPGFYNRYHPLNELNAGLLLKGRGIGQFIVSKWHLTEITNSSTNAKIKFHYSSYNVDIDGGISSHSSTADTRQKVNSTHEKFKGQCKRITKIEYSEKESIDFIYSLGMRLDLESDKSLSEIIIKYEGVNKFTWKFNYGYFVGHQILESQNIQVSDHHWARLCLKSVQKVGGKSEEPPTKFDYYVGLHENGVFLNKVPPRNSFFQDHWGYYLSWAYGESEMTPGYILNHSFTNKSFLSNLTSFGYMDPDMNYARVGLIKTMTYPLGGSVTYEYEQNKSIILGQTQEVDMGGVRVKKVTINDGFDLGNNKVLEYSYIREDNTSSGWGYEAPIYSSNHSSIRIYKCGDRKFGPSNVLGFASSLNKAFQTGYTKAVQKFISSHSISDFTLNSNNFQSLIVWVIFFLSDLFSANYETFIPTTYQSKRINYNVIPFQYSRVVVADKTDLAAVTTNVYEFTSNDDFPLESNVQSFPYSSKSRLAQWQYGKVKKHTILINNTPVKEIENIYESFKSYYTVGNNFLSRTWRPLNILYGCHFQYSYLVGDNFGSISQEEYAPLYGRMELKEMKEHTYNSSGQSVVKSSHFFYNSDFQVSRTESSNSKGEIIETRTYYPNDYAFTSGVISEMKNRNILNIPVLNQVFLRRNGVNYLIKGSITEFTQIINGDIKPLNLFSFQNDIPVNENVVAFNPNTLIPNSSYFRNTTQNQYLAIGIPATVSSDEGKIATFVDYENKLTTATVINASYDDVAYTSFEAQNKGNWNYSPNNVVNEFVPTGKKCFRFPEQGSEIYKEGAVNGLKYILSFWSKGGAPGIKKEIPVSPYLSSDGIVLLHSYLNLSTGWTYYEYEVSNPSPIKLTNTHDFNGNQYGVPLVFLIDELRYYPSNARITSFAFDPLIGKTSECDANGRITYYEYDDLGRILTIRDEKRNLLKAWEYNYKQ
jgi:YD repeat-containing protein